MKWHKPEFCTEPGPSGPEGIKTRSRILRAGNFAEGCRGIHRKRGSGGGATMGGDAHRSPPPAAFWFLFRRRKRNSPKGRNPVRRRAESSRPTDVMVYGGRADLGSAPTTSQADYSRTGKRERQSPPLRDGGEAFCAGGCAKNTAPRRPFEKRAWRGLITTKCIIMCDF